MNNKIAIIPARGGSKRLHRKNVLKFKGHPIISYTIKAAIESNLFDKVVVSTEDKEIAEISVHYGAQVHQRDKELSNDKAAVVEVCKDVIERERVFGKKYNVICCCYATAPLRTSNDIKATISLLEEGKCDYAIAVTSYSHYAHQAFRLDNDGFIEPMWPELVKMRSDAVGKLVAGNGSTYAAYVPAFLKTKRFFGPKTRCYLMPFYRSIDIDTQDDFDLALAIAKHFNIKL